MFLIILHHGFLWRVRGKGMRAEYDTMVWITCWVCQFQLWCDHYRVTLLAMERGRSLVLWRMATTLPTGTTSTCSGTHTDRCSSVSQFIKCMLLYHACTWLWVCLSYLGMLYVPCTCILCTCIWHCVCSWVSINCTLNCDDPLPSFCYTFQIWCRERVQRMRSRPCPHQWGVLMRDWMMSWRWTHWSLWLQSRGHRSREHQRRDCGHSTRTRSVSQCSVVLCMYMCQQSVWESKGCG